MRRKYAGIGSRQTPAPMLERMTEMAQQLFSRNWILRSGGADGADTAFAKGAGRYKDIFRPLKYPTEGSMNVAAVHHPAWDKCNVYAKRLLARNAQIILGENLDDPVEFVAFWRPNVNRGGTLHSLRIAATYKIPTYDVEQIENLDEWYDLVASLDNDQ